MPKILKSVTLGVAMAAFMAVAPQAASAHDRHDDDRRDSNRYDRQYDRAYSDRDYSDRDYHVDYGRIIEVRRVSLRGRNSGVGTMAGAVIGGAIGSEIGEGDPAHVIGGVILGSLIGTAIEDDASGHRNGYEYTIRRQDGHVFTVVQQGNRHHLRRGERVRIIEGDRLRIEPEYGDRDRSRDRGRNRDYDRRYRRH